MSTVRLMSSIHTPVEPVELTLRHIRLNSILNKRREMAYDMPLANQDSDVYDPNSTVAYTSSLGIDSGSLQT